MKRFFINAMFLVIGTFMFGCSTETQNDESIDSIQIQSVGQQVDGLDLNEDAAYAALFEELDVVNEKYLTLSDNADIEDVEITPFVIGGDKPIKTLKRAAVVAACDAVGAIFALKIGPWGAAVGGIAASIWAACNWRKLDNVIIWIEGGFTIPCSTYLSSCNYDGYDELGLAHNVAILNIMESYSLDNIENVSLNQMQNIVLSSLQNNEYMSFPPTYTPDDLYLAIYNTKNILERNEYDAVKALNYFAMTNPTQQNICSLAKNYINTLNNVSDANLVNWHIEYRQTIENSAIAIDAKQTMRSCMSIGLASSNLWYYEQQ